MKIDSSRKKAFPFRMNKAALLVIDMQNYFTSPDSHACVPTVGEIIPRINALITAFNAAKRPVFFTRHIDVDPDNLMARWWAGRIEEKSPMSLINSAFDESRGETIIKHQYDAFLKTDLEKKLRAAKVEQIVITGVVTHLCCETTARSAFMRDFETFFVTDATASFEREHHEAAIYNLSHGFVIPVVTDELIKKI